jgi:peptide/nickel transport system permease protein
VTAVAADLTATTDIDADAPDAPGGPAAPQPRGLLWRRPVRTGRSAVRIISVPVTVFLLASFVTYALGAIGHANPAAEVLGDTATPADIVRLNHVFGLDKPFLVQYVDWLGHALTGNLGQSYFTSIPVTTSVTQALPVDLSLAVLAMLIAVLVGSAFGIAAALRPGSKFDHAVTLVCAGLATVPPFIVGIALIVVFAVFLKLLPSGGYVGLSQDPGQWLRFAILPALALSVEGGAAIARQLRTSLSAALRENYVTGAAARGLSSRRVLLRHVLRNAAGPALTVVGLEIPNLIGGAVVAEKIFNLPGVAQLALQAGNEHDIPVIQGALLVTIGVVLVSNIAVNLALLRLNPQSRQQRKGGAVL